MDNSTQLTPEQQKKLLDFFHPVELSTIKDQFTQVFETAAFDSELPSGEIGRNALSSLFNLIQILNELQETRKEVKNGLIK